MPVQSEKISPSATILGAPALISDGQIRFQDSELLIPFLLCFWSTADCATPAHQTTSPFTNVGKYRKGAGGEG